jgi:IS5 family transposase
MLARPKIADRTKHEPRTVCISKGKEHRKYEFGNKASFVRTQTGVIVGALGFRNEFDRHALGSVLEQTERLRGKAPRKAAVDSAYRGRKQTGETQIPIPTPFNDKKQNKYQQNQ